jgi:hypothetical protein
MLETLKNQSEILHYSRVDSQWISENSKSSIEMVGKRLRIRWQHKIVRGCKIKLPHKRGSNYYCWMN